MVFDLPYKLQPRFLFVSWPAAAAAAATVKPTTQTTIEKTTERTGHVMHEMMYAFISGSINGRTHIAKSARKREKKWKLHKLKLITTEIFEFDCRKQRTPNERRKKFGIQAHQKVIFQKQFMAAQKCE